MVKAHARLTKDHQFVLFHDADLGCRTDAAGPLTACTVVELKKLDVGYGYTADAGRSFPLRGFGVGLMPTLDEALKAYPTYPFLVQLKDGDPKAGDLMARYLEKRKLAQWHRLECFGQTRPLERLKMLVPDAQT